MKRKTAYKYSHMADDVRQRLKTARKECHLRQKDVSEKTGIAQSFISEFESGKRMLTVSDTFMLCELYGKSPAYIFTGIEYEQTKQNVNSIEKFFALASRLSSLPEGNAGEISQSFLYISMYYLVRCLYKADPRHDNTRLFSLDDVEALLLLERAAQSLSPALNGRMKGSPGPAPCIEPEESELDTLTELILLAEGRKGHSTP